MEYIYDLLDNIKNRYGVFIGCKSLNRLSTFVSGYECAVYDLTGMRIGFDSRFQCFVESYVGVRTSGLHWDKILEKNRSQEDAFDLFFIVLDEFKRDYPSTKE